jgi:hypothetical protein
LLPIRSLLDVETLLNTYKLVSLPLDESTTNRKAVKEAKLYATQLLRNWELEWQKGGWHMPESHFFYQTYIGTRGAAI